MANEVVFKDEKVQRFLSELSKRHKQVTKGDNQYIKLTSAIVFKDVMDHFAKQAGPSGPWRKWSAVYADHMAKAGKGGNKILQDTGRLRQSFAPTKVRNTSKGIAWFNAAKTRDGFPYASAHQEGGPQLPQRKFMWLSDKGMDDIADQTLKFLTR